MSHIHDEVHETPLAERLVRDAIRGWLDAELGLAAIGNGTATERELGRTEMAKAIRNTYLANYEYTVVPEILDQLRRAGLLVDRPAE